MVTYWESSHEREGDKEFIHIPLLLPYLQRSEPSGQVEWELHWSFETTQRLSSQRYGWSIGQAATIGHYE